MNKPITLSPALSGDKSSLSEKTRQEIQALSGAQPMEFLLQATGAWAIIIASITLATHLDNIWITLTTIPIIATRFNILGLLVHEQVHQLGLRGRYGDSLANILAGYPLGMTVENYARVHLSHHKYYFTENDPDFLRKSGQDWTFPMRTGHLAKLLLSDLIGLSFLKFLKGKRLKNKPLYNRLHPTPAWLRPCFYTGIAILLTYTGTWPIFLVYWLLPLLTIFPLIVRLGAICEHVYNLPGASINESSPLIILNWWEKLILPNLNFTLHTYHHFFPGIAWCNLPKVHEIFKRENLVNEEAIFHGYLDYLEYLQTPRAENMNPIRHHQTGYF
ncbi:MAG: fatty acid desaturase [Nitrosomonas sp. PRO4]|uniref:fatty acid desaturase n=1 Tax=Nitrosomonas sp. TaxID=42353 RepID=UPI002B3AC5EF|nr:fatty acid desaturase [Nitrosomonas sp.]MCE7915939.1 fatty acid desaturase [Nitrosomonas sp. PRO4]MEB2332134.1 fatty acid desaturase [Nitrosomonas sp.]